MAGNNQKKGGGRASGGAVAGGGTAAEPAKRTAMQYQPSLGDRKLGKSITTEQRRIRYLKKEGLTPDEPKLIQAQDRLQGLVRRSMKGAATMGGIRVSLRSKKAAGARYRFGARAITKRGDTWTSRSSKAIRTNREFARAMDTRADAPLRGRLQGTTRGQGNLLTGGFSDRVRGRRLRPA